MIHINLDNQQNSNTIKPNYTPSIPVTDATLVIEQSLGLNGETQLIGAKNAVLVIIASLLLTEGKSVLTNVPCSDDVLQMIELLRDLGAQVIFYADKNTLEVDTRFVNNCKVNPAIMKKMRASILVMGPLLARFSRAEIALPGGCIIGDRPIDFHIKNFEKMNVDCQIDGEFLIGVTKKLKAAKLVLEYPSVGATENLMMAAVLTPGITHIINAALEPEVLDLITVLRSMGANIEILPPATLEIRGVDSLFPVTHHVMYDRLEAGALLLSAAITGGTISLPQADHTIMEVFLLKLQEMGHSVSMGPSGKGIHLQATKQPRAISFTTGPYPGFPTDLQAPMMAAQCLAAGKSVIHETVFENRFLHVRELQKMGAQITVNGDRVQVTGVDVLYGASVIATDIRASCALVLAGLAAKGTTVVTGIHHWKRGYELLEKKLAALGANIVLKKASC